MCDYWVNFIKTGDPNGLDSQKMELPYWPRLDENKPVRMLFKDDSRPVGWELTEIEKFLIGEYLKREG